MKVYISIILLLTLLCCSCNQHNKVHPYGEFTNLVNLDEEHVVSIYDLFSEVEIIPMETNEESVMGYPITKMLIDNGQFYFSTHKGNAIWQFDSSGHFIRKINHYGAGPHEYSELSDFRFNRFTGDLEILCTWGYLNVYEHSGNIFKKRISFDKEHISVLHNFIELSQNKYLLFSASKRGNKMIWYDVSNNDIISEDYNLPEFLFFNTPYHHTYTPFYVFNDTVHFVQAGNGEVFVADTIGGLRTKYNFDFGKYNFDISKLEEESVEFYVRHSHSIGTKYANRFLAYGENSNYYISRFSFQKGIQHLLMDKKNNNIITFGRTKEKCLLMPVYMDENFLYYFASPQELQVAINPKILSDEDVVRFNSVSPDDNLVVIKCKFK